MRLRVWLPPLAELRADSSLEFQLLDARRRVINRNEGVIAALPKGIDCEIVLDAFDVLLLEVALPKLSGARLAKALSGLVEEQLLGEVERNLVVAGERDASGKAAVAVVDRALLKRALEIFERANRRVLQVTAQPLALKLPLDGGWRIRLRDRKGSVRTSVSGGCSFLVKDGPPVELRLMLSQAPRPPASIEVDGDCDFQAWSEAFNIPVKAARVSEHAAPVVLDLMQYEFSRGIVSWQAWRPSIALAALLLLITLGGLNLHAWSLHSREKDLRERMAQIVTESFPGTTVVLDPLLQMRRMTDELRAGAGTERGGFLMLASTLGSVAGSDTVQSMDYRDGRLAVKFVPRKADNAAGQAALSEKAASLGLDLRFSGDTAMLQSRANP
jgi:general secretion pathway protein L